ncbi:VOC family protein [Arthrobacter sp. alpha11c]
MMTNDIKASEVSLAGIHHLKIPVTNLQTSLKWYEEILGAKRCAEFDHFDREGNLFAYIVTIPGIDTYFELRLAPKIAERMKGFDPTILSVGTLEELELWEQHLNQQGVANSSVLRGIVGWLLVCHDPDGLAIRFYTLETHEFDAAGSDMDSPWVVYPE